MTVIKDFFLFCLPIHSCLLRFKTNDKSHGRLQLLCWSVITHIPLAYVYPSLFSLSSLDGARISLLEAQLDGEPALLHPTTCAGSVQVLVCFFAAGLLSYRYLPLSVCTYVADPMTVSLYYVLYM